MSTTTMSSKGQVVLPKEVRDRLGWKAGLTFEVVEAGRSVVLRPIPEVQPKTVDEVYGCLAYSGPPKSLEEMEEGIAFGAQQGL